MIVYLYDLIYILPICIAALRLICPVTEEITVGVPGLIVAVLICGVLVVIRHIDGKLKLVIGGVTATFIIGLFWVSGLESFHLEEADARYLAYAVVIGICSFVFGRIVIRFSAMRYVLGVLIIGTLVFCLLWLRTNDKVATALLFFVLITAVVEIIQKWNKPTGVGLYSMDVVYVLPFIGLFLILIMIFKIPSKPYDWRHVRKVVEVAEKYAENTTQFVEWKFSTKSTFADVGFSDKAMLRSGIISNPSKELSLETRYISAPRIYVTGKVFDTFDGREWHSTYTANTKDKMLDTMETLCALKSYSPEYMYDYVTPARVEIQYITAKTPYVFTPQKSIIDERFMKNINCHMQGDNLVYEKINKFKERYEVIFEKFNYRTPEFKEFLESDAVPESKNWNNLIKEYSLGNSTGYSYEDYLKYRNRIYDNYTEEVELSDEMQEYLNIFIKEGNSDYEKAIAIEKMLSTFKYNTKPGEIPDDVNSPSEFLDYFVLDKKEGFCTYYATAFVLLARSQGLPARYVQGFQVPLEYYDTSKGNEKGKIAYAMSDMAHAWPEVYFEGKGWIPFEPTPGYFVESGWATTGEKKEFTHTTYEKKTEAAGDEINLTEELPQEEEKESINPLVIAIPVLLVLLFLAVFITISRLTAKSRYRKIDTGGKVISWTKKNLGLLKIMGLGIEQGETLEEYSKRLGESINCIDFIGNYEILLYSSSKATEEMIKQAIENHGQLLNELKRKSRFMYFVYRLNMLFR